MGRLLFTTCLIAAFLLQSVQVMATACQSTPVDGPVATHDVSHETNVSYGSHGETPATDCCDTVCLDCIHCSCPMSLLATSRKAASADHGASPAIHPSPAPLTTSPAAPFRPPISH